ncbi:MAG: DUF6600 domain-containing protein [Gemmatimonadota bacterium]
MKSRFALVGMLILALVAALGCVTRVYVPASTSYVPPPPTAPDHPEEVEMFYEDLSVSGSWEWVEGPGWVWSPYNISIDWRPYTLGHWTYTDRGWTWVSNEDFGWAVYHYGRWTYEASYGWVWVPGMDWAPAWVSWHRGHDWVGWAPLPWRVKWRAGSGLDWGGVSVRASINTTSWSFVRTRDLLEVNLGHHIAPAARNVTLVKITNNVTNYTVVNNRIINGGLKVGVVQKAIGRPVPRLRVRESASPRGKRDRIVNDTELLIYKAGVAGSQLLRPKARADRPKTRPASVSSPGYRVGAAPVEKPRAVPPGQARREKAEKRRLEARHRQEKNRLKRIHAFESQKPPAGVPRKEVNRRQNEEKKALQGKQQQERSRFKQWKTLHKPSPQPGKAVSSGPGSKVVPAAKGKKSTKSEKSKSGKSRSGKSKSDKSESGDSQSEDED